MDAGHKTHRPCPGAAVLCTAAFSGALASQNINGLMRRGLFLMCRNIDSLGGTRRVKRLCEEITTPPDGSLPGRRRACPIVPDIMAACYNTKHVGVRFTLCRPRSFFFIIIVVFYLHRRSGPDSERPARATWHRSCFEI